MFLLRVTGALDAGRVPYAVVGGHAVTLHGTMRETLDLDVALRFSESSFQLAEKALRSLSLEPRLPVTASEVCRFRKDYIRNRNLMEWSFFNHADSSEMVDVILTHDLATMRVIRIRVRDQFVKVASIEDLIRMKEESGRPQDLEDVRALRDCYAAPSAASNGVHNAWRSGERVLASLAQGTHARSGKG